MFQQFPSLSWWVRASAKKFRTCHQNWYVRVQRNFLSKLFERWNFFSSILHFLQNILEFWRTNFRTVVEPSFYESERTSWGNKKGRKKVIQTFFGLCERKIQTLTRKISAELSEQHCTYPEVEFQARNCFWKYRILQFSPTSRRVFRTVSDKFLAGLSLIH